MLGGKYSTPLRPRVGAKSKLTRCWNSRSGLGRNFHRGISRPQLVSHLLEIFHSLKLEPQSVPNPPGWRYCCTSIFTPVLIPPVLSPAFNASHYKHAIWNFLIRTAWALKDVGNYFGVMISKMVDSWGFERGKTVRAAPYDFRFAPPSQVPKHKRVGIYCM